MAQPSPERPRLVAPTIAAAVAFLILCGLGTWQVRRLAEKRTYLAEIDARTHALPSPIPVETDWKTLKPADYEYRRVTLSGRYGSADALVYRPEGNGRAQDQGPGFLLMTPLTLAGGGVVIVDRGFVPEGHVMDAAKAVGPANVTGLMRGPEERNLFTPADDPAHNRFYTRDPAALAAHLKLSQAAPFTIDADDTSRLGGWPIGSQTLIAIPNNHLAYAATWYGLAATLVVIWYAFIRSRRRGA